MKEIKFRGKRINSEEWVCGYLVKADNGDCFLFNMSWEGMGYRMDHVQVIPESVQYSYLEVKKCVK